MEHEQCILIPAILGNDFVQANSGAKESGIRELLLDMSKHCSCQEFLKSHDPKIRQNFEEAKKFYLEVTCPPHFSNAEDSEVVSSSEPDVVGEVIIREEASISPECATVSCNEKVVSLPKWVLKKFESGCFLTFLIKVCCVKFYRSPKIVEVIEKESAWKISRGIRQFLYGFMGIPPDTKINEIIREDYFPSFNNEDLVSVRNFAKNPINITNPIFTNPNDHKDELQDLNCTDSIELPQNISW